MKRWRTTVNVGLSRSQLSPPSPQTPACLPACRQHAIPRIPAANQDAPINKDSKSPNPRSLRQHTLAEPIPPCCFGSCFCFRLVLRHRPFHHTNLQVSPASIEVKVLILAASAYITCLRLRISCFRIYLSTPTASALGLPAPAMARLVPGPQPTDPFAMPTGRRSGIFASGRSLEETGG